MKSRSTLFSLALLLSSSFSPAQSPAPAPTNRAIIILDASGSMWGKVQGKAKIEIAREVIRDFVEGLPDQVELGLVAYGHRSKGDCKDIELLIEPGAVSKKDFVATVNAIQPKGMTPLTDAVEFAAEKLKFEEQRANVILVTDGEETCDRDPCEAAEKLEALGLDFTAHVIAFDLADKAAQSVKCLATGTGGQFLRAKDAATLKEALDSAMEATVAPQDVSLRAPKLAPVETPIVVSWSSASKLQGHVGFVPKGKTDLVEKMPLPQGDKTTLRTPATPGVYEIQILDESTKKVIAHSDLEVYLNDIQLEAPADALVDSLVKVSWKGTEMEGDYVAIVAKDHPNEVAPSLSTRIKEDNPLHVKAPSKPGNAEVRYIRGADQRVLARKAIEIKEFEVTLQAPESAASGSKVRITYESPQHEGDYLTIVPKSWEDSKYANYEYAKDEKIVEVLAPEFVGTAEIRYVSGPSKKVLARVDLQLSANDIVMEAPRRAVAGAKVKVQFKAPNNPGDYITVVPQSFADEKYGDYSYVEDLDTVMVSAPIQTGAAEIRYVSGQSKKVLERLPLEVTEADISLEAPAEAASGSRVKIQYVGPKNEGDYLTIVPKGHPDTKYGKYAYCRPDDEGELEVIAPEINGEAEIRYVSGQGQKILARASIMLKESAITLEVPEKAVSGSLVKIPYVGPNNPSDYITIVPVGFPENKYAKFDYCKPGQEAVSVVAPVVEGDVEVRYVSGQTGKILSRKPLTLEGFNVSFEAPKSAPAGSRIQFNFDGPCNPSDYITIVPAGFPEGKYAKFDYARDVTRPVEIQMPQQTGPAEIRYVCGQSQKTFHRQAIEVTAAP